MSLLPKRSLRLTGQPTDYYQRFTGSSGEIYYDKTLETLRVFPGNVSVGKVVAAFDLGGRLPLGTSAGAVYANQTTGSITIGDYIGASGQPLAPSTVVQVGGATNAFAISAYGPPSVGWQFGRNGALTLPGDIKSNGNINIEINLADSTLQRWQFGEDGLLTFPDGTSQSTAWLGAGTPVFTNLIDSQDSSAITVTPAAIFSSDVTVENDLLAKNIVNGSQRWTFGTDGSLTLPIGVSIDSNVSPLYPKIIADSGKLFSVQGQGSTGSAALAWSLNPNTDTQYAAVGVNRGGGDDLAKVVLVAGNTTPTLKVWKFDETGILTLPTGGAIADSANYIKLTPAGGANEYQALLIYPTAGDGNHIHLAAPYGGTTELYLGNDLHYVKLANSGNIEVLANNGVNIAGWIFDTDGALTIPGDIKSDSNINIEINLSDSTLRRWQFGEDGILTFPDGTNQSTAGVALPVCVINSSTTGSNIGEVSVNFTVTNPSGVAITAIGIYVPSVNTSNAAQDVGNTNTGTQAKTLTALTGNTRYWAQVYAVTASGTAYSAPNYLSVTSICLLAGTMISMADGTYKAIEDITYSDRMLSWDFDRGCYAETTALWIKQAETGSQYNLLTFSDGTTLRTFDQHRIFNKQAGAFTYPMTDATPIGTVTVNEHGEEITLIGKQVVVDTIEYYNVITDHHMNLFSDTVLTSCRFNNIYPILDMKFVKDARTLRTRDEFENIPDRFFYGLRLAEQTYELDMIEWYVTRLLSVEHSVELALA